LACVAVARRDRSVGRDRLHVAPDAAADTGAALGIRERFAQPRELLLRRVARRLGSVAVEPIQERVETLLGLALDRGELPGTQIARPLRVRAAHCGSDH